MTVCDFSSLNQVGLNLQAILAVDELPEVVKCELRQLDPAARYRRLVLIGNAGPGLWAEIKRAGVVSNDPIDDFSVAAVRRWLAAQFPGNAYEIVYPGPKLLNLQSVGEAAGWHHPSPFMLGIQEGLGTWYAYRALVLLDSECVPSRVRETISPCATCEAKACTGSCPAGAMSDGAFALDKCISYRKSPASRCVTTCIARTSCPVGATHRYSDEQMRHMYAISLEAIRRNC